MHCLRQVHTSLCACLVLISSEALIIERGLLSGVASRRHADYRYDHALQAHIWRFCYILRPSSDQSQWLRQKRSALCVLRTILWYGGISVLCGGTLHLGVRGHRRFHVLQRPRSRGDGHGDTTSSWHSLVSSTSESPSFLLSAREGGPRV